MDRGELQKKAAEAIRELVEKTAKLEEDLRLLRKEASTAAGLKRMTHANFELAVA